MPMTEDFTAFFNSAEHGTEATYGAASVIGIFENQYVEVNGVGSTKPTFLCSESDVSGIANGSTITINAVAYTVAGPPQEDGTGLTLLILQEP
jgi:hypothetical protein